METTIEVNTSGLDRHVMVGILSRKKRRIFRVGLNSAYRLNNGWIAHRRAPESNWRDHAYWSIYLTLADYEAKKMFAGSAETLAAALDIALRKQAGEFKDSQPL